MATASRSSLTSLCRAAIVLALAAPNLPTPAQAQARPADGPWSLHLRGTISGTSYESEPDGYKAYSGIALETGVRRSVGSVLAIEAGMRSESREVTGPPDATTALGSAEMLAIAALVQWRPRGRSAAPFQPYLGAGGALTVTWEKSGALDSAELSPRLDPAVQGGLDFALTSRVALNLDARWQTLRVTIDDYVATPPEVKIDPLVLGLGVRVAF
jgi:outer membrane protein W